MESDNRVIINCGGIRHETYKAELATNFRESFNNIWRKLKQGQIIEDFSKCSKNFREISLTALSESARIR